MGREEARRVGARFASTPEKNPSGSGRLVLAHGSLARWSNLRVHLPAFFQGGYFVERKNPTQPILRANALRGSRGSRVTCGLQNLWRLWRFQNPRRAKGAWPREQPVQLNFNFTRIPPQSPTDSLTQLMDVGAQRTSLDGGPNGRGARVPKGGAATLRWPPFSYSTKWDRTCSAL